jgi:hypothetical protein
MSVWDRFVVDCVAGIFFCVGLAKIFSYRSSPRAVGAQPAGLRFGMRYGGIAVLGLFEIAAGLALALPPSFLPQYAPALLAVTGLALLTTIAAIYQASRRQSMVPNIMLFLLVLFVAIVRWV